MCRPETGEASGPGFDHGAEGVVAQCALLLQVDTDPGERIAVQHLIQQGAIGGAALLG